MKSIWDDIFFIPERERKGILALLIILILSYTFYSFRQRIFSDPEIQNTEEIKALNEWSASFTAFNEPSEDSVLHSNSPTYTFIENKKQFHDGDILPEKLNPNTASYQQLIRKGFPAHTAASILSYRKKGGVFRFADDLKKSPGINDSIFQLLLPSIDLPRKSPLTGDKKSESPIPTALIDLNSTDTTTLIALPCIGSKLASRIIQYRDRLGGFHSVSQLQEIYGLSPDCFKVLESRTTIIRPWNRISLNTCSVEDLKKIPYIKYQVALAIISYREKHGPYSTVEDIRKTDLVNDELYLKIAPYFSVQ
ncbi:MAG: helix-hairpin-helix domain-containing protein [Flavobacteriales bacterium]|nr:helix-hairpin-helix domain-containing protein [Flavobacteriales bacterium]